MVNNNNNGIKNEESGHENIVDPHLPRVTHIVDNTSDSVEFTTKSSCCETLYTIVAVFGDSINTNIYIHFCNILANNTHIVPLLMYDTAPDNMIAGSEGVEDSNNDNSNGSNNDVYANDRGIEEVRDHTTNTNVTDKVAGDENSSLNTNINGNVNTMNKNINEEINMDNIINEEIYVNEYANAFITLAYYISQIEYTQRCILELIHFTAMMMLRALQIILVSILEYVYINVNTILSI